MLLKKTTKRFLKIIIRIFNCNNMLTTVALLKTKQDKLCVCVRARERVCVYDKPTSARETIH